MRKQIDIKTDKKVGMSIVRLLGYIFSIVGLLITFNSVTAGRFVCERSKNRCELYKRYIWEPYQKQQEMLLSDIAYAYVDKKFSNIEGSSDERIVYQVVLKQKPFQKLAVGGLPLGAYSGDYNKYESRSNKINNYLNSQEEYLEIKESIVRLIFSFSSTYTLLLVLIYLLTTESFGGFSRKKKKRKEIMQLKINGKEVDVGPSQHIQEKLGHKIK